MTECQCSVRDDDHEVPHVILSTDMCLRLVEAGLSLRDIQSCSRVSRDWRQTWDAAMGESPKFFLESFFADYDVSSGHSRLGSPGRASGESSDQGPGDRICAHEHGREDRYNEFLKRMRERLVCFLDSADITLVPLGMPERGLPEPLQRRSFQEVAVVGSKLERSFVTDIRVVLVYFDGLVAWKLDENHFVVDDLRERSWQRLPFAKHEEWGWTYHSPEIACLTKEMLVCAGAGEIFVYNIKTGSLVKFESGAGDINAVGRDIITLCNSSRRIVRYRMEWRGLFFNAENGDVLKVNEIRLAHPNYSHIFSDGESTDTIFAVSHGKKKIVVYEFLHCTLQTEHRTWVRYPDFSENRDMQLWSCCKRTDSRGNVELGTTSYYWHMTMGRYAISSIVFNIPSRRFHWRHHVVQPRHVWRQEAMCRWNGWQYVMEMVSSDDSSSWEHIEGVKVVADQCTTLADDIEEHMSMRGLQRVEYNVQEKAVELLKADFWVPQIFADDEFVVFSTDKRRASYGVLTLKGSRGEVPEGGTILSRV